MLVIAIDDGLSLAGQHAGRGSIACGLRQLRLNFVCRYNYGDGSDSVQLLQGAVRAGQVHVHTTSQVALLRHQPGAAVLRLLAPVHHHFHAAARLRRTRRSRSLSTPRLHCFDLLARDVIYRVGQKSDTDVE